MPQSAEKVLDHAPLFREPEYTEMLKRKGEAEGLPPKDETKRAADWTKSWEYREKNFSRESLTVNPAKACQPLGAVFCAAGFEKTMSFVHGSQGCVAYYRSHLARHFKEPSSVVSSSMTEDAAVFGGLNNMVDGLQNTYKLYEPKMIAVSTTCMAEVIGDDLQAFIATAKTKGSVPQDFDVPFAHTPAFVGSHVTGYDNMLKGILEHCWKGQERAAEDRLNLIPGFDGFAVGNVREIRRMLDLMGVRYTVLSDVSDQYDTPSDGQYRMFAGGTTIEDTKAALHASATLSMQEYCTTKTLEYAAGLNHRA
jgi:nitrogenase molybdenum-iron protein beta chain